MFAGSGVFLGRVVARPRLNRPRPLFEITRSSLSVPFSEKCIALRSPVFRLHTHDGVHDEREPVPGRIC